MAFKLLVTSPASHPHRGLQAATPKTIRQRLLHVAGRITPNGRRLHLDQDWPWTPTLLTGIEHAETLTDNRAA